MTVRIFCDLYLVDHVCVTIATHCMWIFLGGCLQVLHYDPLGSVCTYCDISTIPTFELN